MLPLRPLLARNLGLSRRKTDAVIAEAEEAGIQLPDSVDPALLPMPLSLPDGDIVLHNEFHLLFHKPAGCVTALEDSRHPTVMDYLDDVPLLAELRPVGRLDLDTTGLLLFTTSGSFLHTLSHPRTGIPRTYQAALARPHDAYHPGMALKDGLVPNITHLGPLSREAIHPALAPHAETQCYATITITGGAYHEVRRIFAALGSHVLSLCRISFGPFVLPTDLAPGGYREVLSDEINRAIDDAKAAHRR